MRNIEVDILMCGAGMRPKAYEMLVIEGYAIIGFARKVQMMSSKGFTSYGK